MERERSRRGRERERVMTLIRERAVGGAGDGGGEMVLVGVKFDDKSRETLTWTMMTVAGPGDRVIALHVMEDSVAEGTSSLMSRVKTIDSWLAVYEGFCNLKQVDLKIKVCRGGPSVRKVLVREAKASGASKIVVGISQTFHTIHSSISVAKYCARKLSKSLSIYAVDNGKIIFQREATSKIVDPLQDVSRNQLKEPNSAGVNNDSWAIVPVKANEAVSSSHSHVNEELLDSKSGWSFLGSLFSRQGQPLKKCPVNKMCLVRRLFKPPTRNSSSVVYPDQKHSISDVDAGVIVPICPDISCSPISSYDGSNGLPKELKDLRERYSSICRLFSYEEVLLATSNFMPENIVGKGGSSRVYKGYLSDGKELAVKILKPSVDVLKEFVLEIETITTLHHKNIISLIGFCFEHNYLILVYDFLPRGSLEENLYGNKKDGSTFGWHERYKVALGVAEALDHLHNGCDQPVVHRDVKSSNILLSDDFEPQLTDFGLASHLSTPSSLICTDVSGTFGYLAPEYFMHGKLSDKVDVFAFGVVLLELLSGRMPIDRENPKGQDSLVMWAKPILEGGNIFELLSPHIQSECDYDQIERMVLAATLCIRCSPRLRPQISLVLKLLQGNEEMRNWARQQINISEEAHFVDEEAFPTNIQSHLNLALMDIVDDSFSISSSNEGISVEDYLQGRRSCPSSFE
uniref:Protein kinase domain-containing protein n=2 Tax=Rhizophora mucronata TaxID=61149 RepID=A0A2P2M019_RHIMU